jgi:rod shape-determining protein MreC
VARTKGSRQPLGRRLFLVLLAVAVVLAVLSGRQLDFARETLLVPAWLLLAGARPLAQAPADFIEGFLAQWRAGRENVGLRRQVLGLQAELAQAQAMLLAAQRKLEGLATPTGLPDIPRVVADVIAGDASPWRESVVVAAGTASGVRRDMPVVWGGAAVGRVAAAGPSSCRVLLLADPKSRAGVRFARTGVRGILAGAGIGRTRVDYVAHNADVRPGDAVVTAGIDGVFPANYLVGVCKTSSPRSGELTLSVEVDPHLRARDLEAVEVLLWQPPQPPPAAQDKSP